MTLLVFGLAATVAFGLLLARAMRRRHPDGPVDGAEREWINIEDLIEPAMTLVTLLLAFMLVQTFSSFQAAETHASAEAGAVDAGYQAANLLPDGDRDTIHADLICYARSVSELEWVTMADRHSSPVVDGWRTSLETDIDAAADHDADRLSLSGLVGLETQLVTSHDQRVAEASPAVPPELTWLIELATLLVIVLLIGFTWHFRPVVRLSLVVTICAMFLIVIIGIRELDSPFSGAIAIPPDRMHETSARIESGGAAADVPCDADGRPTSSSS